jgi:hypothetical protein
MSTPPAPDYGVLRRNKYIVEFYEFRILMRVLGWMPWVVRPVLKGDRLEVTAPFWAVAYSAVLLSVLFALNVFFTITAISVS